MVHEMGYCGFMLSLSQGVWIEMLGLKLLSLSLTSRNKSYMLIPAPLSVECVLSPLKDVKRLSSSGRLLYAGNWFGRVTANVSPAGVYVP